MSYFFEYKTARIEWLHHASFLIQCGGEHLYIDPFKIVEGPTANYILISHDHFDHFDEASIEALSNQSTKVIASSAVKKAGLIDVTMEPGTPAKLGDWMVHCVPAYNVGKSYHQKHSGGCGFLIEYSPQGTTAERRTIYHAGDTDWIPEMSELRERVGVALLPIGGTYTMNVDDAIKAVATIAPEIVIPMHYNMLDETRVSQERLDLFVSGAQTHGSQVVVLDQKYS